MAGFSSTWTIRTTPSTRNTKDEGWSRSLAQVTEPEVADCARHRRRDPARVVRRARVDHERNDHTARPLSRDRCGGDSSSRAVAHERSVIQRQGDARVLETTRLATWVRSVHQVWACRSARGPGLVEEERRRVPYGTERAELEVVQAVQARRERHRGRCHAEGLPDVPRYGGTVAAVDRPRTSRALHR